MEIFDRKVAIAAKEIGRCNAIMAIDQQVTGSGCGIDSWYFNAQDTLEEEGIGVHYLPDMDAGFFGFLAKSGIKREDIPAIIRPDNYPLH